MNASLTCVVHASRDKILLEDDDGRSDDEGDEEEVFALKGMPDDSGDDESVEEDENADAESDDNLEELAAHAARANAKAKKAKGKQKKNGPPSTEGSDSESEEEGWGRTKAAYYSSNAGQLSSDDEEANEMEEQEAKRLQAKARDAMADDDFGLGDAVEAVGEDEPFVIIILADAAVNLIVAAIIFTVNRKMIPRRSRWRVFRKTSTLFFVIWRKQTLKHWHLHETGTILLGLWSRHNRR